MRSVRAAVPFACALACALTASAQSPAPSPAIPPAAAQAGTDLFLLDVSLRGRAVELGRPVRLTERAGYDNQPAFSADGRTLYFTAIADGNADIQRLDLATRRVTPVLRSAESEYSPTPAPGGGLSVVRVETNDTQRLWRIGDDGKADLLLPGIKPVGYHAWRDADTLVLFVLGDPSTLVVAERGSGRAETVARDVGRCIRAVPGRPAVSFVEKVATGEWWLSEVTFPSRALKRLARMPQGVEDYAWLGGARVLAGQGNRLLELVLPDGTWQERARFDAPELQNVTRLALSPAGDRLVLVSDEATPFPLTVDSIMRGPELVGYPPSDLRFSGDAQELYFEWRQPGEDEAATYAVARAGGEPRRLSDEERRLAPGEDCRWDEARRLCLFEDEGDIVLVDTVARKRRQITRTTAAESDPRFTDRRYGGDVRARPEPVPRAARPGGRRDGAGHERRAEEEGARRDGEPEVPEGGGAQAPEARRGGGGAHEAQGGRGRARGAAQAGPGRGTDGARGGRVRRRALRVRGGRRQTEEGAHGGRPRLRDRVRVHRDDPDPLERRGRPGGAAPGDRGQPGAQGGLGLDRGRDGARAGAEEGAEGGRRRGKARRGEEARGPRGRLERARVLDRRTPGRRGGARGRQQGPLAGAAGGRDRPRAASSTRSTTTPGSDRRRTPASAGSTRPASTSSRRRRASSTCTCSTPRPARLRARSPAAGTRCTTRACHATAAPSTSPPARTTRASAISTRCPSRAAPR